MLFGNWELKQRETASHISLHPESTMLVTVSPRDGKSLKPMSFYTDEDRELGPGFGAGVWRLDGKQLTLYVHGILTERGDWTGPGGVHLYKGKIRIIKPDRVEFTDGVIMVRKEAPVRTRGHLQCGQWMVHGHW